MKFDQLTKALAAAGMLVGALTSAYAVQEDPAAAAPAAVGTAGSNAVTVKLCPSGYFRVGTNLCMTGALGPDSFANAMAVCQSMGGSVANYGSWRYRILFGDGVGAPVDWWLGPITADDRALFVNSTDTGNFDGETSRFDSRFYACTRG